LAPCGERSGIKSVHGLDPEPTGPDARPPAWSHPGRDAATSQRRGSGADADEARHFRRRSCHGAYGTHTGANHRRNSFDRMKSLPNTELAARGSFSARERTIRHSLRGRWEDRHGVCRERGLSNPGIHFWGRLWRRGDRERKERNAYSSNGGARSTWSSPRSSFCVHPER